MDEKVASAGERILTELAEWVEKGGSFVSDQAPAVFHEFVLWGIWGNLFTGSIYLVIATILVVLYTKFIRNSKRITDFFNDEFAAMFGTITGGLAVVIFVPVLFAEAICDYRDALKAAVSPRVYIIDQILEKSK